MVNTSQFRVVLASILSLAVINTVGAADATIPGSAARRAVDDALPMVGTDGHGHVYPGAAVPFGMVQLSPDTRLSTWDGCSGYHYSDKSILGFSHTHLSGTGCADLGEIALMPFAGITEPVDGKQPVIASAFSHTDESAKPGYYSVLLKDHNIRVELTATTRAGFHRYSFPPDADPRVEIDLHHGIGSASTALKLTVEDSTTITGIRKSRGWANNKVLYFVIKFSEPMDLTTLDKDEQRQPAGVKEIESAEVVTGTGRGQNRKPANLRAFAMFKKGLQKPLLVKVGISSTSLEAAKKNLETEIPSWDFDAIAAAAADTWQKHLGVIAIETPDIATRQTFYSNFYLTHMAPTLYNDADGTYRGQDHNVHPFEGFQNYETFSLWDTFRAEHPLLTIVQPGRIDDFVGSMLAHYRYFNQHSLPVWPLAGCETWCMIGYHSVPVLADAYFKGFRKTDFEAVFAAMKDTAMQDRNELKNYRERGYIPTRRRGESVSRTLEYSYDDWCIAQMASALGKGEDEKLFTQRANYFKNVFDAESGLMRGKLADGTWVTPFDPNKVNFDDYTEANAWQYSFAPMHDIASLVTLMGGDDKFIAKLDTLFTTESKTPPGLVDITGLVGQYAHGNEPCHHVPYLYVYAGAPWKSQEIVRKLAAMFYTNKPDGQCGNVDCGQMTAWYVFSALGFYPVNPANGIYIIGSPVVDKATINLDPAFYKGKTFTMIAENNSKENIYIQSATLNGKPLDRAWITHKEITDGGTLAFKMGPQPNKEWGRNAASRPPVSAWQMK